MTTYVTVDNKVLRNDDVKKYDLGLESQNQDRIYLPFASYKGDILARAYEVIYWSTLEFRIEEQGGISDQGVTSFKKQ